MNHFTHPPPPLWDSHSEHYIMICTQMSRRKALRAICRVYCITARCACYAHIETPGLAALQPSRRRVSPFPDRHSSVASHGITEFRVLPAEAAWMPSIQIREMLHDACVYSRRTWWVSRAGGPSRLPPEGRAGLRECKLACTPTHSY